MADRTCTADDCDRIHWAHGLCHMHYKRHARRVSAESRPASGCSNEERFWRKVLKTDHCWLWLGGKSGGGYGMFRVYVPQPRHYCAHQYAYLLAHAALPAEGLEIDHLCRNRLCVNPAHLEAVTHAENMLRRGDRKVSDQTAQDIRAAYVELRNYRAVAREFGISPAHARRLCVGESHAIRWLAPTP